MLRVIRIALRAMLLAAAVAPAAAAAAPVRPHVYSDPQDAIGKLDVEQAVLTQHGPQLQVDITTWKPWAAATLARNRGRSLCVRFTSRGERSVCVVPAGHGRLGLTIAGGRASASGPRGVRVIFPAAAAGLGSGRFAWRVDSTWADSHRRVAAAAPGCADAVPDKGAAHARLFDVTPVGCQARPPWEVRLAATGRREIALTFDDGPAPDTPRFLDLLEREHAPATFFMIGRQVPGNGALIKRMLRDGDMVGNHSLTHANLAGGGLQAAFELDRTQANIRDASGFTPCLFRPPYGAVSGVLVGEAGERGLVTTLWNDDTRDWARPGVAAIHATALGEATPGGIVIMHDGGGDRSETLAALPAIIHDLRARGYTLVTVTQLLGLQLLYR